MPRRAPATCRSTATPRTSGADPKPRARVPRTSSHSRPLLLGLRLLLALLPLHRFPRSATTPRATPLRATTQSTPFLRIYTLGTRVHPRFSLFFVSLRSYLSIVAIAGSPFTLLPSVFTVFTIDVDRIPRFWVSPVSSIRKNSVRLFFSEMNRGD